jgi:hypothetical protein
MKNWTDRLKRTDRNPFTKALFSSNDVDGGMLYDTEKDGEAESLVFKGTVLQPTSNETRQERILH